MASDDPRISSDREQTDESLRVERKKVDQALGETLAAIDAAADAVIERARARADDVLAAARAKTDGRSTMTPRSTHSPESLRRKLEDRIVREERADADETVRVERSEYGALLSVERKETDRDLFDERAQADDALATRDEFLGIVSHDLRNMLHSVIHFAALIEKRVVLEKHEEPVLKYSQRIQRAGARMNRLIGDLVDVVSIEAGMLAVTREVSDPLYTVNEALDTLKPLAGAAGIALIAGLVPPASPVAFDAARILQVLVNLLSNAVKFTPARGKVVVQVEQVGAEVQFAVSDTGRGIPAAELEAVFERFHQVSKDDRRGMGLGLYISKCIVQGHGGRIWAESTVGEGSTFVFTLPVLVAG